MLRLLFRYSFYKDNHYPYSKYLKSLGSTHTKQRHTLEKFQTEIKAFHVLAHSEPLLFLSGVLQCLKPRIFLDYRFFPSLLVI